MPRPAPLSQPYRQFGEAEHGAVGLGAEVIDHLALRVRDLQRSTRFYATALAPLGYAVQLEVPGGVGLGTSAKPDLWLYLGTPAIDPVHVAVGAADRAQVDAFHRAALAAGAVDVAAPRVRPEYHPGYYGAFVTDPDGVNLEAVHHTF